MHYSDRGFITLAFGNPDYRRMAQALCASFRRFFHQGQFAVVTDDVDDKRLREFDFKINYEPQFGTGMEQKLHLFEYSPFKETIFVDSDCLFYKNPESLWDLYRGGDDFAVRGWRYTKPGDTVHGLRDLIHFMRELGISRYPKMNGGIYYFRKSDRAQKMFQAAREIGENSKHLGLLPVKYSKFSDEVVISGAMEKVGIELLDWDNGRAMEMTYQMEPDHEININIPSAKFRVHGRSVDPIVIHFSVGAQYSSLYCLESERILRLNSSTAFLATPAATTKRAMKVFRRKLQRFEEVYLGRHRYG